MHMGLQSTLKFLRMHTIWILKGRQVILYVLRDSIVCKFYNACTGNYPSIAPLPVFRVNVATKLY